MVVTADPGAWDEGERLACGASSDDLLEQVSAGRAGDLDEHQAGCPHCQAALAEYDRLWAPVREVADTEVIAPGSVLREALRRIRSAAADPTYGTIDGPDGALRVAARVVVVVARETAQDIDGVRVVLGRLLTAGTAPEPGTVPADSIPSTRPEGSGEGPAQPSGARVVAGVSGRSTAVEVVLAADYGTDLLELGERIRVEVTHQVRRLTGLEPVVVSVRIDDVFD